MCVVCLVENNQDKLLCCEGCELKHHTFCLTPKLKKIPQGSWLCKKCIILNAKACSVCTSTEDDENMLLCDACDEGFHLHCLVPPLVKVPKDEHWFCKNCNISDSEVVACKLLLGYKELHLEVRRLMQSVCEDLCKNYHKTVKQNTNSKKVIATLGEISSNLTSIRKHLTSTANISLHSWREKLLQLAPSEDHHNNNK